ncbi:MAG TPA: serine/threonine-protein kinase, partial [Roseiflexaceae bacterium]|nr:serine/threonine-protein kinase [Roseiflexaceae bacterium]
MADTLAGTRLGAYELQRLLGSGGMAAVYQAFDHNLHRTVAVKVLAPEAALQPGFADRFQQEARLVARLHHPNIVQVYDFGQQDGITYMVQELLPGPTLARFMQEQHARGQAIGRDEVLEIVRQLAAGLDAAHAEGIIHREVKPANALWNAAETLVLTDFGIAKPTLESGKLTQVGMILGTPAYLSPEQAQGLPLSPASDVYAL